MDGVVSKLLLLGARYDAAQLRVKPRGSLNVAMPDGADFVRGSTVILEDGTEHRTTLDAEAYDAMSAAGNELDWFGKVPGLDEAKIEILLMSGKSLIDMRDAIDSGRAKTMIDLYDLAGEMAIEKCAGRQALYSMQQALAAVFFEAHSRKAEYITEELLQNAAKWLGAMNEAEYATSPVAELEMYIKDDRMPLFEPPPSPDGSPPRRRSVSRSASPEKAGPLKVQVVHRSYQVYYAARALRDFHWPLPNLPWQLGEEWQEVCAVGGAMGPQFWGGVSANTPLDVAMRALDSIRDFSGDRAVRYEVFGGFLTFADTSRMDHLDWSEMVLDDEGMRSLFKAFGKGSMKALNRLHLNNNRIGTGGMACLTDSLMRGAFPKMTQLRLSHNLLRDGGLAELGRGLKEGCMANLEHLYLNNNEIGDDGMRALAASLQPKLDYRGRVKRGFVMPLSKLEVFTLAHNKIGMDGMHALADVCRQHGALQKMKRFLLIYNPGVPRPVVEGIGAYQEWMKEEAIRVAKEKEEEAERQKKAAEMRASQVSPPKGAPGSRRGSIDLGSSQQKPGSRQGSRRGSMSQSPGGQRSGSKSPGKSRRGSVSGQGSPSKSPERK